MLVEQDHALADASPSDDAKGEPRVLVIYRSRGVPWLLLPPLLILSSVAAIVVYRRSERSETPTPPAVASVVLAKTKSEEVPLVIAGSSSADVGTAAKVTDSKPPNSEPVPSQNQTPPLTPPMASTTIPPGSGEPSTPTLPFDPAPPVVAKAEPPPAPTNPPSPPERVGFDPGALQVGHAPVLPPPPDEPQTATNPPVPESPPLIIVEKPVSTAVAPLIPSFVAIPAAKVPQVEKPRTEEAQAEINREAEIQGARRRELAALKPELLRGDPRERQAQRDEIAAVARRQEAEKRGPFHTDLRQILREQGRNGGREIQTLCERYGTEYPPEIFVPLTRDLTGPATRMTVPARVDRMRRWGLPETLILDDLYEKEERRINSPGGPRTRDEAWVFAARRLLTMPPPPAPPRPAAQPAALPPPTSPPAQ